MERENPALTDHLLRPDAPRPDNISEISSKNDDQKFVETASYPNHATTSRLEAWWMFEIGGLLVSIVCITLIVALLHMHDGKPFSSYTFYFSLNTVVSVLGSIARATLLVAVSASIAQGKWIWFRKRSDSVNMFEIIDSASREALGSLRLIWYTRGRHLVTIGAFVALLSIAIEPSLQALISDSGRLEDVAVSSPATIAKAERFDGGTQCVDQTSPIEFGSLDGVRVNQNVSTTPDFGISAAIYNGFNTDSSRFMPNVSFACSSGNCTWFLYASLAVSSSCFDVSDHLIQQPQRQIEAACPVSYGAPSLPTQKFEREVLENSDIPVYSASSSTKASTILNSSKSSKASSRTSKSLAHPSVSTTPTDQPGPSESSSSSPGLADGPISTSGCMTPGARLPGFGGSATVYSLDYTDLSISNFLGKWNDTGYGLGTIMTAGITADPNATVNFKDSQTLLAAFSIIRVDDRYINNTMAWTVAPIVVTECGLSLSLNVYNSSVSNGILNDILVATTSEKAPTSWLPRPKEQQPAKETLQNATDDVLGTMDWNPVFHSVYLAREDYQLDPTPLQQNPMTNNATFNGPFNITQKALDSTVAYISSLIPQTANQSTVNMTTSLHPVFGTPILQPLYSSKNLTQTFERLALSLSNAIRSAGESPMRGTTRKWVIHYRIRWIWLTLPMSLILMSTAFTLLSILETHKARIPAWKSNTIASMIYGPDELLRNRLRTACRSHQSLDRAGETVVVLEDHAFGAALSAVSLSVDCAGQAEAGVAVV